MASNIGMMDPAFFVGRTELLGWINSTLAINLTKIEECAPGHVACQLMDVLHPGKVPLSKVNFAAKNEYEYINNYKVLQSVFDKMEISKNIEVSKLVKARALDNLEFMQWMKAHFDVSIGSGKRLQEYDPEQRRSQVGAKMVTKPGGTARPSSGRPTSARPAASTTAGGTRPTSLAGSRVGTWQNTETGGAAPPAPRAAALQRREPAASTASRNAVDEANKQVEALGEEVTQLKLSVDSIEKERDFYFSKLRDVEILCQMAEFKELPVVKAVISILYASDENVDVLQIAQNAIEQTHSHAPADEEEEDEDEHVAD